MKSLLTLAAGIAIGVAVHVAYKRYRAAIVLRNVHRILREDEERRRGFGLRYVPGGSA